MTAPELGHAVIVNTLKSELPRSAQDVAAVQHALESVGFTVLIFGECHNFPKPSVHICEVVGSLKFHLQTTLQAAEISTTIEIVLILYLLKSFSLFFFCSNLIQIHR